MTNTKVLKKKNEKYNIWKCGKCERERLGVKGDIIPKHHRFCLTNMKCEAGCADLNGHEGGVSLVRVINIEKDGSFSGPYRFYYCEEAIREDERNGFIVKVVT